MKNGTFALSGPADCHEPSANIGPVSDHSLTIGLKHPPRSAPGAPSIDIDPDVMALLELGADYADRIARGQTTGLLRSYLRAEFFLRRERSLSVLAERERVRAAEAEVAREYEELRSRESRARVTPVVYFISNGEGAIKIGHAASARKRIIDLQISNPVELRLLAERPGDKDMEAKYHHRFRKHRIRGEWFAEHPALMREIERFKVT